jgi:four helix bundle protein
MPKPELNQEERDYYTGPARTYRDLLMWQKAHKFVLEVYRLSRAFPKDELNGLTAQTRRAATSMVVNIVQGVRKRSNVDKVRFMNIAQESADECEYCMVLAEDLGYVNTGEARKNLTEVSRLLNSYATAINRRMKSDRA